MRRTANRLVLALASSIACHAGSPPASDPTDAAPPVPTRVPEVDAPVAATPEPEHRVTITNLAPGRFEIGVSERLAIRSAARIERQGEDGGWTPMANLDAGAGYRLLTRCDAPPPACVEVAPGTPLVPVAFTGMGCSSQCNQSCDKNVGVGPGMFRLAIDTCDGRVLAGPGFELPSDRRDVAMVRWGITRDVVRASIVRMHEPDASKDRVKTVPKLVEWRIRAGSERALEPAQLARLLELVAAPDGFDDDIMKRCLMDHLVGFRITRAPASTGEVREEELEMVIDLGCNKLFVRGGSATHPVDHATHFDPSHAAWRDFVREVLPDDRELARVK